MLERTSELRHDYDKAMADYQAAMTAKNIVPPLLKGLTRFVSSLARAMRS